MSGKTIHNLLFSPFHFCTYLFWPAGETDLFQGFSLPVWVWFSQTNLGSNSCLTGSGVWTVLMSQGHGDPAACPQWVEACQMKGLGRRPGKEGGVESSSTLSHPCIFHVSCFIWEDEKPPEELILTAYLFFFSLPCLMCSQTGLQSWGLRKYPCSGNTTMALISERL